MRNSPLRCLQRGVLRILWYLNSVEGIIIVHFSILIVTA